MNNEALENFRIAGLLQPEYLGESGTLPVTINGSSEMVDVIHHINGHIQILKFYICQLKK